MSVKVIAFVSVRPGHEDAFIDAARICVAASRAEAGVDVEYFYYPAGHAFANDDDHLGTYDAENAALAWQRTVDFLHAQLG